MKLGLIACSSNTGLGLQTKAFYDHLKPDRTLVVDISEFNHTAQHPDWYPDGTFVKGFPMDWNIQKFVDGLDVILIAESAYNDYVYDYARYKGVRTVNQHNYEFFSWLALPISDPDGFISPSKWHYEDVQKYCDEHARAHTYLHFPVDREAFPYHPISEAKVFVHNAGRPAIFDRNGTFSVIEASKHVKSDVKIRIHFQGEQGLAHQRSNAIHDYYEYAEDHGDMDKLILETSEYDHPSDIYNEGDVLLYPRRYGGNSLVLNEALSWGMPVIMTDISPNNELLPPEWLVPAFHKDTFTPRTQIDVYEADVHALAERIDWFASLDKTAMLGESAKADSIAEDISWGTMHPRYTDFLEEVLTLPIPE